MALSSPVLSARTLPFKSLALRQTSPIPYHPLSQLPPVPTLPPVAPTTPTPPINSADVTRSAVSPLARLAAARTAAPPAAAPPGSAASQVAPSVNVLPPGRIPTAGKAFIPGDELGMTAPPPPAAPPAPPETGGGSGGGAPIDWDALINADPSYIKTRAAEDAAIQSAANTEADTARQDLLGFGSQSMANSVLQALAQSDPELGRALSGWQQFVGQTDAKGNPVISDNPDTSTSTLAQLARWYRDTGLSNDEGLNGQGLFFSGARARALNDLSYQNETKIGGATQALQAALQNASGGYAGARQNAMDQILNAYQAAYERALSMATS